MRQIAEPNGYNYELEAGIRAVLDEQATPQGEWSVAVISEGSGQLIAGVNPNLEAEALSLSKLLVAIAAQQKSATNPNYLTYDLPIVESDVRDGGFLRYFMARRMTAPASEVLKTTLRISDTTGQRALVRHLGGIDKVNGHVRASGVPLSVSGLVPAEEGQTGPSARFYAGNTTPREAALMLRAALRYPLAAEALREGVFTYGLRRDLPRNAKPSNGFQTELRLAATRGSLPTGGAGGLLRPKYRPTPYPNIMGVAEDMRHDVALIGPYIIAALSSGYDPKLAENARHPAHQVHAALGKLVWDHANPNAR